MLWHVSSMAHLLKVAYSNNPSLVRKIDLRKIDLRKIDLRKIRKIDLRKMAE